MNPAVDVIAGKYLLRTLGCKANLYDSQLIESELQRRGWRPLDAADDATQVSGNLLCIVNSCTVTDEADIQSRKLASRLGRDNPQARVVITGCSAEVDPERLAGTPGIHYVIGNREKPALIDMILSKFSEERPEQGHSEILGATRGFEEMLSQHPIDREWSTPEYAFRTPPSLLQGQAGRTRAFLKIQEGCNAFCTYCVIPYGRGPSRSLRPREIAMQVRQLVAEGVREVVLTGTNIGDYGGDWAQLSSTSPLTAGGEPPLTELITLILRETDLERLRLSSLDPLEITPGLLRLIEVEPRLCPHFHASIQNVDSHILKRMKRKYNAKHTEEVLQKIAALKPAAAANGGVFVGMDLITGFPGETAELFESSLQKLAELPWSRLHVFPFSERVGTPATRLGGSVPQHERLDRSRRLMALSLERQRQWYENALTEVMKGSGMFTDVLLERGSQRTEDGRSWRAGYTANYVRILVPESSDFNKVICAVPEHVIVDSRHGDVAITARLVTHAGSA